MIVLAGLFMMNPGHANAAEQATNYERDYLSEIYDSEDGLDGTAVKSICSDEKGFLWMGGYTGLYKYDGTEFEKYQINDRSVTVNDIVQDEDGNLWIGTNGDGIYCFDGESFTECKMDQKLDGADIILKLLIDTEGNLFAGTKNGFYRIDQDYTAHCYEGTENQVFQDVKELDSGEKLLIEKTGRMYLLDKAETEINEIKLSEKTDEPRCSTSGKDGFFYVGTTGSSILKISNTGEVQQVIDADGLSSINEIYEFQSGKYWICSDTGIGFLENDKVKKQQFQMNDSVEEVCTDYQGNYWFVSSRQGVMQLYQNGISDLGQYWGISQAVNSIQEYNGMMYVGCEDGLYCYQDKTRVENSLTEACEGARIRQLYKDSENNLWVSTYQDGIKVFRNTGEIISFRAENSGLTTNQIRCVTETEDGSIVIGTENGLFEEKNQEIQVMTEDERLSTRRILDVSEYDGSVYVATDGYGVYEIKDHAVVQVYTKQQGLASNIVLKTVPSEQMKGIWLVSAEGISFLDQKKKIQNVTGVEMADSMDLVLTDDDRAFILAGNGLFAAKESELLQEEVYVEQLDKTRGIPIDFTANARNIIQDGKLYMCGINGAASIDLTGTQERKIPRIYLKEFTADGKPVDIKDNKVHLAASVQELDIVVRVINYMHQNLYMLYDLSVTDKNQAYREEDRVHQLSNTSYADLKGGNYIYHYQLFDDYSMDTDPIAELELTIQKDYGFLEEPKIRRMFFFMVFAVLIVGNMLFLFVREKIIKKQYHVKFQKAREEELAKMAYTDMVTGAYNRNRFEQEKERLDMKEMYAFFSVSVNYLNYIRSKYGSIYFEEILRKAMDALRECTEEGTEFFRVSENVFYFWAVKPVKLENYVLKLKESFQNRQEEEKVPLSLAVGAVYNNRVDNEKIEDLIGRCEKMRLLDEKHAEAKFIEGKLKVL